MATQIIPQGNLNRLRGSITFASFPGLNITSGYLGKDGISLSFDNDATLSIDTMTGLVQSPEPYQRATASAHLLKTQALAQSFKSLIESSTLIGDMVIRPDTIAVGSGVGASGSQSVGGIGPYSVTNTVVASVNPLRFNGQDVGWIIMLRGAYLINAALWNT